MTTLQSTPLVSCLMVTRDRPLLARRAVECLAQQTYRNLELVVVDDGDVCYEAMLAPYRSAFSIRYLRVPYDAKARLGALRNISLDHARGELLVQWDDDEWYHPSRIATQVDFLRAHRLHAVVLRHTLMHVDTPEFREHPFRTALTFGTPGTVLHRRTSLRYPNLSRAEDSAFLRRLFVEGRGRVRALGSDASHLFIRCFHGANTWHASHFTERLTKGVRNWCSALYAKHVKRDPFSHRLYRLDEREKLSFQAFQRMCHDLSCPGVSAAARPTDAHREEPSVEQREERPPHVGQVGVVETV